MSDSSSIPLPPAARPAAAAACRRARENDLSYAAAASPPEAFDILRADPRARLIDVRTEAEWRYVGQPLVDNLASIEWQHFPDMTHNGNFLRELESVCPKDAPALFLCRSGARSHSAAEIAAAAGWLFAANVIEGFEGDLNDGGHRNQANGWRFRGLPWRQS